jgi:hypothetical protein
MLVQVLSVMGDKRAPSIHDIKSRADTEIIPKVLLEAVKTL